MTTHDKPAAYDEIADLYSNTFQSFKYRRREFRWLRSRLGPSPGFVVDLGCGNGALLKDLAPTISRGLGLDVSQKMLDHARAQAKSHNNLDYQVFSNDHIPLPDASVDTIISTLAFRYMDWKLIIPEILRVLRPNGKILIIDMAKLPANPSLLDQAARTLSPIKNLFRTLFQSLLRRKFNRALKTMVSQEAWKTMTAQNPTRTYEEYLSGFAPLKGTFKVLDRSRAALVFGFESAHRFTLSPPKLAILDWGIGGIGFAQLLEAQLGKIPYLYLSDSGFTPYGKASARALVERLNQIMAHLAHSGVESLVIACNAMSSALTDSRVKVPAGFRVTGVISPTLASLAHYPKKNLGIIGGKRTIESGLYQGPLEAQGKKVTAIIAQPLSALIEGGMQTSPLMDEALSHLLPPLSDCDALVLACTHYPAALDQISPRIPGVEIIDPARLTIEWVQANWKLSQTDNQTSIFITTGNAALSKDSAQKAWGFDHAAFYQLPLEFCLGVLP